MNISCWHSDSCYGLKDSSSCCGIGVFCRELLSVLNNQWGRVKEYGLLSHPEQSLEMESTGETECDSVSCRRVTKTTRKNQRRNRTVLPFIEHKESLISFKSMKIETITCSGLRYTTKTLNEGVSVHICSSLHLLFCQHMDFWPNTLLIFYLIFHFCVGVKAHNV